MEYLSLSEPSRKFKHRTRSTSDDRSGYHRLLLILILAPILLLASVGQVMADSPPNLNTDIPWSGGASSVTDVEAAFNHGRREEEKQLSLGTGSLGNLDLPSQAAWDATSADAKALLILNAERTARAGMKAGVIGLPFTAIQADVDNLAQYYANYLVANNKTGHEADGRTPFQRIDADPVLGPCHEFLHRAENLAYAWTSGTSYPLVLERSIYNWIYKDASSAWGHREAALLQDKALGFSNPDYGFNNNVGSPADEGFIGLGMAQSPAYDPDGLGWVNMGYAIVLNMIDPISTGTCPWDGGPTVTGITPNTGANTGTAQITNLAGSNFQAGATVKLKKSGQSDIVATNVQVVSGSKITCNLNLAGAAAGQWDVVVTNPDTKSGKLANGFTVTGAVVGPTITSITPNTGPNTGPIQVTNLSGSGFQDGASVRLSKQGETDIWASNLQVVSASKITCRLDLTGAAPGTWDVVVINRDDASATLPNGFRITEPGPVTPYSALLPIIRRPRAGQTTLRFVAGADTTVLKGDPNTYFGAEQSMWTGYDVCWNYQTARSLLGFNLTSIPAGATIDKATLHLVHNHTCHDGPSSRTITAYRIGTNWNTNTVTWNTQPSQAGSYGQVVVTTGQFQWYSMDVTDLVRGWVNGSFPNLGVMLRGPESSSGQPAVIGFATLQYMQGEFAAVLEVTYRSSLAAGGEAVGLGGFEPGPEAAPLGAGTEQGVLPIGAR